MVAHDVAKSEGFLNQLFGPNSAVAMGDLKYILLPAAMFFGRLSDAKRFMLDIANTNDLRDATGPAASWVWRSKAEFGYMMSSFWNTGNRVMNGLVVGLLPIGRQILLTDRLIHSMDANQIAAVFLHEIGHAKRNHLLIRFSAVSVPMVGSYCLLTLNGVSEGLAIVFSILVTGLIFGWVAKALEFDADQFASTQLNPGFVALTKATYSLWKSFERTKPKSDRFSWLHPTLSNRIKRLEAMAPTPVLNPSKL